MCLALTSTCLAWDTVDPPARKKRVPLAEAIALSENESAALVVIDDRSESLDESAFYMLLSKAAKLAERKDRRPPHLDRPTAGNLLAKPKRYRGWPINMRLKVYRVEKLTSPVGLSPSVHWPAGQPAWKIDCHDSLSGKPPLGVVIVFSPVEPTMLGKPDTIGDQGEWLFDKDPTMVISGFGYKVWRSKDEGGNIRDYPAVIAWRFDPPPKPKKEASRFSMSQMVGVGLLLLMVYMFVRRYIAMRRGKETPGEVLVTYKPWRQRLAEREAAERANEDAQVDPELKAAANQHRKEKEHHDADD